MGYLPRKILLFLFIVIIFIRINAQSVEGKILNSFSICQNAEYQVVIKNNESYQLEQLNIEIVFPCDLEYFPGSVQNAEELNIEHLHNPKFSTKNLPIDSSIIITFSIFAPCSVLECVNNSTVFFNQFKVSHDQGVKNINSEPFNVETPQLIITKVEKPVLEGFKGANLSRKIHIRNTRLGKLSEFIYKNSSDDGILVSATNGHDISENAGELILKFDKNDFQKIGDKDEWFEFNEEIIIEEKILVETCAYDLLTAKSDISASWGCGGMTCDSAIQNAVIDINVNYEPGQIVTFSPVLKEPTCYDSGIPQEQRINIRNTSGFTEVSNLYIQVIQNANFAAIPGESVHFISGGDTLDAIVRYQENNPSACDTASDVFKRFNVVIPQLYPGQSGSLIWANQFCTNEPCFSKANAWSYQYHYYKECASPGDQYYQSGLPIKVEQYEFLLKSELLPGPLLKNGHSDSIQYKIESPLLRQNEGSLLIELEAGCGMHFEREELLFGGDLPDSTSHFTVDEKKYLSLSYNLPISDPSRSTLIIPFFIMDDNDCFGFGFPPKDTLITSCPVDSICQLPPPTFPENPKVKITANTSIVYDNNCDPEFHIKSCDSEEYKLKYQTIGYIFDTIPGYLDYGFEVYRTSLGLPDNDNDNIPDEEGELDFSKIRRDHAVTGDTIKLEIRGRIVSDIPKTNFSHMQFIIEFRLEDYEVLSDKDLLSEYFKFMDSNNGLINLGNNFYFIDSSSMKTYQFDGVDFNYTTKINLEDTLMVAVLEVDLIDLKEKYNLLPSDVYLNEGDSIIFQSFYRINYNLNFNHSKYFNFFNINLRSKAIIDTLPILDYSTSFICNCKDQYLKVANYFLSAFQHSYGFSPCFAGRGIETGFRFGTNPNYFPYEIKSPVSLQEIQFPKLESFDLKSWSINRLRINGNNLLGSINTDYSKEEIELLDIPNEIQGFHKKSLKDNITFPLGELVEISTTAVYYLNQCKWIQWRKFPFYFIFSTPFEIEKRVQTNPGFNGNNKPLEFKVPNINNVSSSNLIEYPIDLVYNAQSYRGKSFNAFIKPVHSENIHFLFVEVTDELVNTTFENGIIQITKAVPGNLHNIDKLSAILFFENRGCYSEPITFHYGWNCEPYTDPLETPCEEFFLECTALSPPGIIDMLPQEKEIDALLCDTMPYSEVQIFDAGLGAVYNLEIEANLPRGVSYVANSAEVAWPAESQIYEPIGEPEFTADGALVFPLTDFRDTLAQHGLPGVNSVPNNTISLRYKTKTDCDFISGSEIIYTITADKVCGEPTNSVAKVSKKMKITGINPPYNTNINGDFTGDPGCDDEILLNVYLENLRSGDLIYLEIPSGISVTGIDCESDSDLCPGNTENGQLIFEVPVQLDKEEIHIGLSGFPNLECKSILIPIYSTTKVNTLCVEKNEDCEIEVITGDKKIPFAIERPILGFENFTALPIDFQQDAIDLSFTIVNSGKQHEGALSVDFYLDKDQNGIISPDDVHWREEILQGTIFKDSSLLFTINNFEISPDDLCNLLIYIGNSDQCMCGTASRLVNTPDVYRSYEETYICSDEQTILGRPSIPGYRYKWESNTGIGCDTCSMTSFSQFNGSFEPVQEKLILQQISPDGCLLSFEYVVNIVGQAGIWAADEAVCEGDVAVLFASDGVTYSWEGPFIENPADRVQTIQPLYSSWYSVAITDQYGCTGQDSVFIQVNERPIANAGQDLYACFGSQPSLSALEIDSTYNILWAPGFPYLDDPTLPNPKVLINEDRTFSLTVSKNGCSSTDEVAVSFYDGLDIDYDLDTVICSGADITFNLPSNIHYQWQPLFSDMCADASCNTVIIKPEESVSFNVIATDSGGCKDTFKINIEVADDQILNVSEKEICEGASAEIFGIIQTEPGRYCDTTFFDSGCIYVQCIDLKRKEKIETREDITICSHESFEKEGQILDIPGEYCFTYPSAEGCDSIHCIFLEVLTSPDLRIIPSNIEIKEGDDAQLSVEGADEYIWSPSNTLDCDACDRPLASPEETTTYFVTGINDNGCAVIDSVIVQVITACEYDQLLIPNAITPDGNGKNDVFRIVNFNPELQTLSIRIFNRWGQELFYGRNNEGWDGKYMGVLVAPDVYLYVLQIECGNGEHKIIKGDLTVIR